jgi:hypothetical protein
MSFADKLHADLDAVEAKIENFLHKDEGVVDEDAKAALADAKVDATTLRAQVESEAPTVEADASEALKNGVSDLSAKVSDVVAHPGDVGSDLGDVTKEFEVQEDPAVHHVEGDLEIDAHEDEATAKTQGDDLIHGDANDNPVAPQAGPATTEPAAAPVEEDPEEGSQAAEIKANVEKLQKEFKESQESVPETPNDAETGLDWENRLPDNRQNVAGSVHQV